MSKGLAIVLVAAAVLALSLAWVGGELHRQNCRQDGRTGCSMLPWVQGEKKAQGHSLFDYPRTIGPQSGGF